MFLIRMFIIRQYIQQNCECTITIKCTSVCRVAVVVNIILLTEGYIYIYIYIYCIFFYTSKLLNVP